MTASPAGAGLVVGVGACRDAPAEAVYGLVREVLAELGPAAGPLLELATVEAKATEPGIVEAARLLGVRLRSWAPGVLAAVETPHSSPTALAALGVASVAEAAALAGGGELLVPKRKQGGPGPAVATCAVARRGPAAGVPGDRTTTE
ncbi:cobalamin biosynthesis protein [Streptomyces sp. NA13]|uniref:cobalamin biosynthesis protein n=1 Tax=Streptomyces sp. NA13 TaxID=2996051 RepID=UPI00226F706A|nr:cobalamin biosynthesis protein [Streptomyces sp. NA13]WAC95519.1 cobalamin biosynthesis protein [Streptomyces sp. NA13]